MVTTEIATESTETTIPPPSSTEVVATTTEAIEPETTQPLLLPNTERDTMTTEAIESSQTTQPPPWPPVVTTTTEANDTHDANQNQGLSTESLIGIIIAPTIVLAAVGISMTLLLILYTKRKSTVQVPIT